MRLNSFSIARRRCFRFIHVWINSLGVCSTRWWEIRASRSDLLSKDIGLLNDNVKRNGQFSEWLSKFDNAPNAGTPKVCVCVCGSYILCTYWNGKGYKVVDGQLYSNQKHMCHSKHCVLVCDFQHRFWLYAGSQTSAKCRCLCKHSTLLPD